MDIWLTGLIFTLSAADDVLAVFYVRRVNAPGTKSRVQAALISGLLTALICVEVLVYTSAWVYLIPNALGSVLGTWLAMWVDDKYPPKKARDEKGKFKKPLLPGQAIVEVEKGI